MIEPGKLMGVGEVAEYLGRSKKTVYRLVKKGRLSGFKVAGFWRFRSEVVEIYRWKTWMWSRLLSSGLVFDSCVLVAYYQAPQKYQVTYRRTKRGGVNWLSLRQEYLKRLSSAAYRREYFKSIKYRKVRLPLEASSILVSPRYFARLPQAHQKQWLKFEKSPEATLKNCYRSASGGKPERLPAAGRDTGRD